MSLDTFFNQEVNRPGDAEMQSMSGARAASAWAIEAYREATIIQHEASGTAVIQTIFHAGFIPSCEPEPVLAVLHRGIPLPPGYLDGCELGDPPVALVLPGHPQGWRLGVTLWHAMIREIGGRPESEEPRGDEAFFLWLEGDRAVAAAKASGPPHRVLLEAQIGASGFIRGRCRVRRLEGPGLRATVDAAWVTPAEDRHEAHRGGGRIPPMRPGRAGLQRALHPRRPSPGPPCGRGPHHLLRRCRDAADPPDCRAYLLEPDVRI